MTRGPDRSTGGLRGRWLGRIGFDEAFALQEQIVRDHEHEGDTILLLEHDPVYTTGRLGKDENLPPLDGEIPLRRIGRGGDVTYHGPGQLVGYVLVDLRARGGDVHLFLRSLEAGVIALLGDLGVAAARVDGRTGAWVLKGSDKQAAEKIASIGIGVRRGISMHGFAVNVAADLTAFDAIVPCDLTGVSMTSVERETGRRAPSLDAVADSAVRRISEALTLRATSGTAT